MTVTESKTPVTNARRPAAQWAFGNVCKSWLLLLLLPLLLLLLLLLCLRSLCAAMWL
jgi:hypothetical protein